MTATRCAVKGRNRFLGFHEDLRARLGAAYRVYKPLEVVKLDKAFDSLLRSRKRGADFVCEMVARLSWEQALPNLNHRTTLSFAHAMLAHHEIHAPWAQSPDGLAHAPRTEAWMKRSKAIMADRDMWNEGSRPWNNLRKNQRQETCLWIKGEAQSGRLAYAGPHLLKNFLSCSVRKGRGSD